MLIEKEKEKYNELHKREVKYGGKTGRAKAFLRAKDKLHLKVKEGLNNSKTLLDVGCGKGFMLKFFKSRYKHLKITGVDIANEVNEYCKKFDFYCCSANSMPFDTNSFDIVIHQDGMEHIPIDIEKDVMNEICRVANKYIYMTIAIHEIGRDNGKIGNDKVHCNIKSVKEWKKIFIEFVLKNNIKHWLFDADKNWVYVYMEK